MGATNNTTYYNLSQFVGTDKPAWLQDYNGDMNKIDAGIHQAKAAADAAQGDATQALTDSGNNTTAIGNLQTDVGNLQTATGNNAGAINSINSLIGNGTPTTTDQTIIGGINELNSGKVGHKLAASVTADGVKTIIELFEELGALIDFTKISVDSYLQYGDTRHLARCYGHQNELAIFSETESRGHEITINGYIISSLQGYNTADKVKLSGNTVTNTNLHATVPAVDTVISIYY